MTDSLIATEKQIEPHSTERGTSRRDFGVDSSGRAVTRTTLRSASGADVSFLSLGGIVQSMRMPDRNGQLDEVILGFDDLGSYLRDTRYVGALVGRYANRIAFAAYPSIGDVVRLEANEPPHHLHGGVHGFHSRHWQVETFTTAAVVGARLRYESPNGDQGYPGALTVVATYTLSDDNVFAIEYEASTTETTPVNLTHHAYFNLGASSVATVLDHTLQLQATRFLPVDQTLIPTGELRSVGGTPLDFTTAERIGERIALSGGSDEQLTWARGYDHCYALDRHGRTLTPAAWLHERESGRTLEIHTTEPGIQVCTGNSFDGSQMQRNGEPLNQYAGVALETQHFPDSPNRTEFPSTLLSPGERYHSRTEYRFTVSG